jgi:hypothetical protein
VSKSKKQESTIKAGTVNFLRMAEALMEIGTLVEYQDITRVCDFLSTLIEIGGQSWDESIINQVENDEEVLRKLVCGGVLSCVNGFLTVPQGYLTLQARNKK